MLSINKIGFNIRTLRKSMGLKQNELALSVDLSPDYIGKIERGEKIPSLKSIVSFANFFHVSITELAKNDISLANENKNNLLYIKSIFSISEYSEDDYEYLYQLAKRIYSY